MASPASIDLSNNHLYLVRSTQGRAGVPDGNVFFDSTNGKIEFLALEEVATVTYPLGHPGYSDGLAEANPLTELLGLKLAAAYDFENRERAVSYPADASGPSEDLRSFNRWTEGTFKFGGSYNFIFGRQPATDADRNILRGSGWNEATGSVINSKYFGVKGLGAILTDSIPYFQSTQYGTTTPFNKLGNIDEATQVYGDAANGDFDNTDTTITNMYMSVRTYGQNYGRINANITLGIPELGGYSTGAALNESEHLTTGAYALADVYTAPIAPWDGMSLEKLTSAQHEIGFSGGDTGDFIWVLNNTGGGTLEQCVAYLDALAQADAIVTTGEELLNGKSYDVWYEYTAAGLVRPLVGTTNYTTEGLFIENLPGIDKTSVEFRDDAGQVLVYPVYTPVAVDMGAGAIADVNAWFHTFEAALYDTAGAVTYTDAVAAEVKGLSEVADPFVSGTSFSFEHDYTTNGDQDVVVLCEGDGAVTQAKTVFTISSASVSQTCIPAAETNT